MIVISIDELKEKGAFEVEEFKECIESCRYYTIKDYGENEVSDDDRTKPCPYH